MCTFFCAKKWFSMSCFYLKSCVLFIYAHSCHSLVYAKSQLDPWVEEKYSEGIRLSDYGRWSRKCWKLVEKWCQRQKMNTQHCKIALLTQNLRCAGSLKRLVETACPLGESYSICQWACWVAVGDGNYVYFFGAKISVWVVSIQNRWLYFSTPHRCHSLVYAKPQLHPWADEKYSEGPRFSDHGSWSRKCW